MISDLGFADLLLNWLIQIDEDELEFKCCPFVYKRAFAVSVILLFHRETAPMYEYDVRVPQVSKAGKLTLPR